MSKFINDMTLTLYTNHTNNKFLKLVLKKKPSVKHKQKSHVSISITCALKRFNNLLISIKCWLKIVRNSCQTMADMLYCLLWNQKKSVQSIRQIRPKLDQSCQRCSSKK